MSTALFPPQQRKTFHNAVLDEILQERVVSSRNRRNPRGVKRKMSNVPLCPRHVKPLPKINIRKAILPCDGVVRQPKCGRAKRPGIYRRVKGSRVITPSTRR